MMQCLKAVDIDPSSLKALLCGQEEQGKEECLRVLKYLTDRQLYDEARNFAAHAGIPADCVTMAQVRKYQLQYFHTSFSLYPKKMNF